MKYLIFDMVVQKSLVLEEVLECTISITANLTSYAVELNHILVHTLIVCRKQVVELMLCITNGVMRTKVYPEFQNKLKVAVHSEGMESGEKERRRSSSRDRRRLDRSSSS